MPRPVLAVLAVALVAVLAIGLLQGGSRNEAGDVPAALSREEVLAPLAGAPAPLARLHARTAAVTDGSVRAYEAQLRELRGYPVVVNAWATWCGPCKLEFPLFQRAASRLGKRVAFLGLNVSDDRRAAERYLEETPVPYPSLVDADFAVLGAAAQGAKGLPVTVFYDRRGRRTSIHQGGYTTEADLLADIRRYAGA